MHKFSVFIPTFNAQRWIGSCLESIYKQDYPKDKIEVIVVDGGSTDQTRKVIGEYPVRLFDNPRRIAHYAFSIYGQQANADLTVMFSADNELSGFDWLSSVNKAFEDYPRLCGLWGRIISGKDDRPINKYFALIQSEPLSYFTNKNIDYYIRTGQSVDVYGKKAKLFRVDLRKPLVWGANGLVLRLDAVRKYFIGDDFMGDNDIFQNMIEDGNNLVAYMPSLNIVHHHVNSVKEWTKKLERNYKQHFLEHRQSRNMRWAFGPDFTRRMAAWLLYAGFPVFSGMHAILLAIRDKSPYWLYHPLLSFIQFFTYARLTIFTTKGRMFIRQMVLKKI